jgi:cell wall-associated NlpC family hydrolase
VNWTDRYIGIPFAFDGRDRSGCDCWGLVRLVYEEVLGRGLPMVDGTLKDCSVGSLARVARTIKAGLEDWERVETPRDFDIIIFRTGNVNTHVGLVCGRGQMLHIQEGINATVEHYNSLEWKLKIYGIFRHAK